MLAGDLATGKAILRDYINATIGFEALGRATGTPAKSLMRMFGPRGNPQASHLFAVLGHLQEHGGFQLEVRTEQGATANGWRPQRSQRMLLHQLRSGRLICIRINAPNMTSVSVNEYGRRVL